MNEIIVRPGDVVVTDFDFYQHWSLVTDRLCQQGKYMLISATSRNGTVKEEPWDVVTQGKHTYVADIETNKSVSNILSDARAQIGEWVYSVTSNNCEHFVKWSTGLKVTSKQVIAGTGGALVGVALVKDLSENPKFVKFLFGALIIGGVAIALTKASEKV
jgi:hypothetical protein